MFIKNSIKNTELRHLFFFFLVITLVCLLEANQEGIYTAGAKGLKIKIIRDNNINFIHAELLIFYNDKEINPAIIQLTLLNVFDQDVNGSGSNLLNTLRKLGNDYEVQHRPDYLLFKVNFLPDRISMFAQFLKGLYTYKAFTLKKFNYSIHNYWKLFLGRKNCEKQAAFQVAYSKLFPEHPLGNTLNHPGLLEKINLAQIRSYYQETYTPANSLLIMKGDLEPPLAVGTLNRAFRTFKPQSKKETKTEKLNINDIREVIIYHIDNTNPPHIFWFEVIPPLNHEDHIPFRVANDILFGLHIGRLFQSVLFNGIKILGLNTEVINHKEVSVICNTIRLNFKDIEKFILLADIEKKKLRTGKIERKEYLNVKNYFFGQMKVNTARFENDVELERDRSLFNSGEGYLKEFDEMTQRLTLDKLNGITSDLGKGIIIIVGNANIIMNHLSTLKQSVIRFSIKFFQQ